ncbi:hypothetical protein SRHO_G00026290 [Serrasalmus rhombeus]
MTTIIVSLAAERFGLEEKRAGNLPYTMNNRANKIHQLRQELHQRWTSMGRSPAGRRSRRCLTDYLLRNSYIDTLAQKGGIPKMPGCLEHTDVVTQLIMET